MRHPSFIFILALIVVAAVPVAFGQNIQDSCSSGGAQDFEVGFRIETDDVHLPDARFRVTVENADGVVDVRYADSDVPIPGTDCHWVAHVGEENPNPQFRARTRSTLSVSNASAGAATLSRPTRTAT